MGTWIIENIFALIGFGAAGVSFVWGLAVKFAKFEEKDSHQEHRLVSLERKHEENHSLHISNETRLVKLEAEVSFTKDAVIEISKKLSDLQTFLMEHFK